MVETFPIFRINKFREEVESSLRRRRRLFAGVSLAILALVAWASSDELADGRWAGFAGMLAVTAVFLLMVFAALALFGLLGKPADCVTALQVTDDRIVFHHLWSGETEEALGELSDVLTRYRDWIWGYDRMIIVLAFRNGRIWEGGNCKGEIIEAVAREVRRRAQHFGTDLGTPESDRRFRLGQRKRTTVITAVLLGICTIFTIIPAVLVTRFHTMETTIRTRGIAAKAKLFHATSRGRFTDVTYTFRALDGDTYYGVGRFSRLDAAKLDSEAIPIRYLPGKPKENRADGGESGALSLLFLVSLWAITALCLAGTVLTLCQWDLATARGKLYMVKKGRLEDDYVPRDASVLPEGVEPVPPYRPDEASSPE